MIAKVLEVRDDGTFIPVLAIKLEPANEAERYLIARAGYGKEAERQAEYIALFYLEPRGRENLNGCYNHYDWTEGSRTMRVAHEYIERFFHNLESGDVVDVQWILGETEQPKVSEAVAYGYAVFQLVKVR